MLTPAAYWIAGLFIGWMAMSLKTRFASDLFLDDVRQYVAFLDEWFSPERWSSAEPSIPHRSGVPTSAEIAYVLLRFGRFRSSNWEQWKSKGFTAMDSAIDNAVVQTRGLLRELRKGRAARADGTSPAAHGVSAERYMSVSPPQRTGAASAFIQDPLLHAIAVHVYTSCEECGIRAQKEFDRISASPPAGLRDR